MVQLQYSILDQDYYGPPPKRSHTQPCDCAGYYPPAPDPPDIQHWHARGRENAPFYMDIDSLEKRPTQQKAGKQGKGDRILNNEFKS